MRAWPLRLTLIVDLTGAHFTFAFRSHHRHEVVLADRVEVVLAKHWLVDGSCSSLARFLRHLTDHGACVCGARSIHTSPLSHRPHNLPARVDL